METGVQHPGGLCRALGIAARKHRGSGSCQGAGDTGVPGHWAWWWLIPWGAWDDAGPGQPVRSLFCFLSKIRRNMGIFRIFPAGLSKLGWRGWKLWVSPASDGLGGFPMTPAALHVVLAPDFAPLSPNSQEAFAAQHSPGGPGCTGTPRAPQLHLTGLQTLTLNQAFTQGAL